ncbi:hypothetical protein GCM10009527_098260 [Actinomadura nitritigenes]|jgi:hypothetical protein|uniref:Uncharacterized protein n=1 Tax=Actinomadura nitritigenes TaxID=134602 RepID=A0ABS3QWG1_9ACTN|nr:hypothetical protein [Actinomadura nitritigenes]MBO2438271.1 hypothetical protein [Actinomadura nitritigenes]
MESRAAGLVIAAGGIAVANDALFAPLAGGEPPWKTLNWRLFPATAILALALAGLEKLAPSFAVGLAGLTVAAVIIVPYGNAKPPLDNVLKVMGY